MYRVKIFLEKNLEDGRLTFEEKILNLKRIKISLENPLFDNSGTELFDKRGIRLIARGD